MSSDAHFELHPRLAADTALVGDLALCRLLLMQDRRFPWCILVPRLPDLTELHQVPREQRMTLLDEVERVSLLLLNELGARKINVAALGNMVPQLHVHVVGRRPGDAVWPGPVWGSGTADPYPTAELQGRLDALRRALVPAT